MAQEWYYARGDQQTGPVPSKRLRELVATRELQPNDLVWTEGMIDWRPARTVMGLFPDPDLDARPISSAVASQPTESAPTPPGGQAKSDLDRPGERPWYCHPIVLTMTTLLFFPVTLYLVWFKSKASLRAKLAWTGACGVILLIVLANGDPERDPRDDREAPAAVGESAAHKATPSMPFMEPSAHKTLIEVDNFVHVPPGAVGLPDEVLSQEYYPYLEGKSILYSQDVVVDRDNILRTNFSIEPSSGGRLRKLIESYVGIVEGNFRKLPNPKTGEPIEPEPPHRYRLRDGYVEIGMPSGQDIWWEPELKLGAKAGDAWESDTPLEYSKYNVESIFMLDDRPCAMIVKRTRTKGVVSEFEQTIWYVKGKGEYRSEMRKTGPSGEAKVIWRRKLSYFPE